MTNEYGDYAARAIEAAEKHHHDRLAVTTGVAVSGIKAITYALLDLASAIREHGRA